MTALQSSSLPSGTHSRLRYLAILAVISSSMPRPVDQEAVSLSDGAVVDKRWSSSWDGYGARRPHPVALPLGFRGPVSSHVRCAACRRGGRRRADKDRQTASHTAPAPRRSRSVFPEGPPPKTSHYPADPRGNLALRDGAPRLMWRSFQAECCLQPGRRLGLSGSRQQGSEMAGPRKLRLSCDSRQPAPLEGGADGPVCPAVTSRPLRRSRLACAHARSQGYARAGR
ncbi:hypothetical protein J2847_002998 [Azospirillum agricola]|nr:hypothetical protein [Azospirillum agricola]